MQPSEQIPNVIIIKRSSDGTLFLPLQTQAWPADTMSRLWPARAKPDNQTREAAVAAPSRSTSQMYDATSIGRPETMLGGSRRMKRWK
jgi:hypothetical protein